MKPIDRRQFLATATAAAVALPLRRVTADEAAPFRVAVIGHTGKGDYGHGIDIMWQHVPDTKVVAVADPVPEGLEKARKKLGGIPGFDDYRRMLAEVKPDIVAIAPRHVDEHHAMSLAAIESGARGVYMEKPFCRSCAEADELVAACEKRGTKLELGHRVRYHPAVATSAKLIKDGLIGRVLEIRGRGKEDARGGAEDLWVLGSHILSLVPPFAGKLLSCSGSLLLNERPVTRADLKDGAEGLGPLGGNELHARFESESGVPVFFDSIAGAGSKEANFGLQLIGTKGIIDIRVDMYPAAHLLAGNPFVTAATPRAWVPISSAGVGAPEPIADVATLVSSHGAGGRDLVAAIRENRAPLCDVKAGAAIIEAICGVFESHRLNGQRVMFPLSTRVNPLTLL